MNLRKTPRWIPPTLGYVGVGLTFFIMVISTLFAGFDGGYVYSPPVFFPFLAIILSPIMGLIGLIFAKKNKNWAWLIILSGLIQLLYLLITNVITYGWDFGFFPFLILPLLIVISGVLFLLRS